MSTAGEFAFDPQVYMDNLYTFTSQEWCLATLYGDMFLTEAEEARFLPASQPLTGIPRLKDQDPQRRAAIHHREVLERSLRSFAGIWAPE
eukprot:425857-Pyramimonas_sp.AAC.1